MKIVMITRHACIRVAKMALPLIEHGHEVHLITNKITQYSELFASVMVWQDINQLCEAVKIHKDADVFHCHNEPSWFVTAVKDTIFSKPVVLDIHDSMLLRRSAEQVNMARDQGDWEIFRYHSDERNNFQLADAIVHVGDHAQEIIIREYKLSQPSIILPSYVPLRFYRVDGYPWIGGLAYEGRIDTPDELPKQYDFFQYANYLDLARECREHQVDFHIYTPRANEEVRKQYDSLCILHPPENFARMIKFMASHDWGLVGNMQPFEEWKHALPNKLFEYMAGQTPVVCFNADQSWEFIKKYGIGIKVDSIEELKKRWGENERCRRNIIKHREKFAMEKHIHLLEELYKQVI